MSIYPAVGFELLAFLDTLGLMEVAGEQLGHGLYVVCQQRFPTGICYYSAVLFHGQNDCSASMCRSGCFKVMCVGFIHESSIFYISSTVQYMYGSVHIPSVVSAPTHTQQTLHDECGLFH